MLRTSTPALLLAPGIEGGVDLGEGHLGEKAEGAEVDAEDGRGGVGEDAGRGEEGAIAAEDDDDVGVMRRAYRRVRWDWGR